MWLILALPDYLYSWHGLNYRNSDDVTTDAVALHPVYGRIRTYNALIRLPVFLSGIGLIGKFCYDIINFFATGEAIENESYAMAQLGMSMLSLATSMYIKEVDPKLLQKESAFYQAYKWFMEKIRMPVPVPNAVKSYSSLEEIN